jgi:cytochrome P450 family 628
MTDISIALQEYKPRMLKHYEVFLRILDHHAEQETEIDASETLLDLFFDVVSDLTFGVSFNTLTTKKRNLFIGEFLKQQKAAGFLIANMPLFYTLRCIPVVDKKIQEWVAWYDESLEVRKNVCCFDIGRLARH